MVPPSDDDPADLERFWRRLRGQPKPKPLGVLEIPKVLPVPSLVPLEVQRGPVVWLQCSTSREVFTPIGPRLALVAIPTGTPNHVLLQTAIPGLPPFTTIVAVGIFLFDGGHPHRLEPLPHPAFVNAGYPVNIDLMVAGLLGPPV